MSTTATATLPAATAATNKHRRGFSFTSKSSKSRRSSANSDNTSNPVTPTPETAEDKARRSIQSKADPTMALSELQPMAVALEKSNLANIREMQHKDQFGNAITEPDLSNPTRPRFERPLDTIRSFEAAMYPVRPPQPSRPASFAKTSPQDPLGIEYSRRTSYAGANDHYSRYGPSRHNSSYGGDGYYTHPADNYYPFNQASQSRSRSRPRPSRRMTSDSGYPSRRNAYAQQGYHTSYDNVTAASGSGSGNTDPYGNSTDPSSINSSFDRLQQQQQQFHHHQQQQDKGHGGDYEYQEYEAPSNYYDAPATQTSPPQRYRHVFGTAPAPDPNAGGPVGGTQAAALGNRRHLRKSTNASEVTDGKESKRKSWFKRKFSKS